MPDQLVDVVGYDPGWPYRFAEQRPVVEGLLSRWLASPVEHIGSTAVPGLRAKPVIDMLAPVSSLADARAAIPVLVEAGWHARALLAFRDALRADAGLRREYGDLKDGLAAEHRDNRNAYTNAKGVFVARVLRAAGVQVPEREHLPE